MNAIEEYVVEKRVSLSTLEADIDSLWQALGNEPGLREELDKIGVDPEFTRQNKRSSVLNVDAGESHADGVTLVVVMAFIGVGKMVAKDIWSKILLPRLRKKYGDQAIKAKKK